MYQSPPARGVQAESTSPSPPSAPSRRTGPPSGSTRRLPPPARLVVVLVPPKQLAPLPLLRADSARQRRVVAVRRRRRRGCGGGRVHFPFLPRRARRADRAIGTKLRDARAQCWCWPSPRLRSARVWRSSSSFIKCALAGGGLHEVGFVEHHRVRHAAVLRSERRASRDPAVSACRRVDARRHALQSLATGGHRSISLFQSVTRSSLAKAKPYRPSCPPRASAACRVAKFSARVFPGTSLLRAAAALAPRASVDRADFPPFDLRARARIRRRLPVTRLVRAAVSTSGRHHLPKPSMVARA